MKWIQKMKERPDQWIFWILLAAFIAGMIPVWYLSRYSVPGCDDYTYGLQTHDAWLSTHSVKAVLETAVQTTKQSWFEWQGTWSSIFLMTLTPGIFGEKWYFLTTFLMSGMLGGGIAALLHVVLKKYVTDGSKETKYQRGICILVIQFLSFQTLVSPALALYWYNGALHYVFMESVLFFQAAVLLSFLKEEKKGKKGIYLALSVLLGAVLGGANLITALQSCILTVFLVLYEWWKKKKNRLWVLLPLASNLAGFALNVLAPGNTVREDTAEGMGVIKSVLMSFYWGAVYITEWLTPIVLIGFVLLLPVIWKMTKQAKAEFFHPLITALLSYCVFAAMFTPTLFATSSDGPDRCKNAMRVVLYLLVFFNLVNASGWLAQHKREGLACRMLTEAEKNYPSWLAVFVLCLGAVFVLPADKNTYTSISAVRSLANGEAALFHEENMERVAIFEAAGEKEAVISYLTVRPYLLFTEDAGNEGSTDYWINLALTDYYHLSGLTVAEK